MATFQKVPRKEGFGWKAIIRRKGLKPVSKTFSQKKAATAWARRVEGDAELAKALGDGRLRTHTITQMLNRYMLEYKGKDLGRLNHLMWWKGRIGERKLIEVDRDTIMDELEVLAKEEVCHAKNGEPMGRRRSPATCNRYLSSLSAVYQSAIGWRWVKKNPCRGIKRGPETHRFGRALSEKEREKLLEECKQSPWEKLYLLVTMALSTGARLGEMLSLSWDDLDFKRCTATLSETKNGSPRVLPLIDAVIQKLQALPRPLDGTTLLFASRHDRHKPYPFRKYWEKAKEGAGIENFRFHDLRHSAASYLTEAGVPLVTVAEILGHRTLAMVQRYSHLAVKHKQEVVNDTFKDLLG